MSLQGIGRRAWAARDRSWLPARFTRYWRRCNSYKLDKPKSTRTCWILHQLHLLLEEVVIDMCLKLRTRSQRPQQQFKQLACADERCVIRDNRFDESCNSES